MNDLDNEPAIHTAPRFITVSGSSESAEEESCRIVFSTADGRKFGIELDLSLVDEVVQILQHAKQAREGN